MKRVNAYSFASALPLPDMFARLNALGPWRWIERDNDRWGEYISAGVLDAPDRGIVKIFVELDRFAVDYVLESESRERLDAVFDTLFAHLLPAIGAQDLAETDHHE